MSDAQGRGAGAPRAGPKRLTGRRTFLSRSAVWGVLLTTGAADRSGRAGLEPPAASGRVLGAPVRAYGTRSRFETASRGQVPSNTRESASSLTPLQRLYGIITPSALHFERHHAGVPEIDPARHRLLIHGLVSRPVVLTLADIRRLPSVSRIHMIECAGNTSTEWVRPTMPDVEGTHGLTSCSEWTGVLLATVLRDLGVKPGARWIIAEGADGGALTRSLPVDKCLDDVLLAYGQNGEALRPEQGYPLRLVVPGWEGSAHVKWLRRLKLVAAPYQTRDETSKYTDLMPDGTARQFTFVMEAKSVITFPSPGAHLPGPGFYEITGLAWSGRGRVTRVEVSVDGGQSWRDAHLQEPVHRMAHTRFRLPWTWDGRERILQSRATDETGYVQPSIRDLARIRGLHSVHHLNAIQSWKLTREGIALNVRA